MTGRLPPRGPGLAAPAAASVALHAVLIGAAAVFAGWYSGGGDGRATLAVEALPPRLPIVLASDELMELPDSPPLAAEPPHLRESAEEWALQLYERAPLCPPVNVWAVPPPRERTKDSQPAAAAPNAATPAVTAPAAPAVTAPAAPAVVAPRLLAESCPPPAYPRLARRRALEGTVWLLLEVAADGQPVAVRLEESSGHGILDDAALAAARGWRLAPATRNGAAEAGALRVPVTFRLAAQATGAPE